ncbi:MAG: tRNA (adenosine(37)-N6)-threonylcarbamoyltransferase complex dimerization subunit type 1 TsaB [Paludibacteraceae bacterium]|nr:tRNA (adenosine(37)-N6)-threonylcarbamoyltransferase complex dimerization subunit type 1 TsaB [Paludibacteraceae bacterium]
MTILCIETSTSVCSAAICKDGVPAEQCICREGSNHARLLPRYIEYLLQYAKDHHLTIEAVALSEGPGSYTGLRIGTSTAKGLCYGLNVPLIPVPTLEILKLASGIQEGILIPMIDARRMEVYTLINEETKAVVVENEESLYAGEEAVNYFGDGAAKCAKIFTKPNWHYIPDIVPEAQFMGALAESGKKKVESVDLAYYEPFYLKEFVAAPSHVKGLK